MALYRIKDFDPDYRDRFDDQDFKGMDLYAGDEKIGSVDDILVDDEGQFRYLVISTGVWVLGKKVLLPIGQARINDYDKSVHADHLTKSQVEALPALADDTTVDYDHEEQVRGIYRSGLRSTRAIPAAYGVGYGGADSAPATKNMAPTLDLNVGYAGYDRETYSYEKEPALYNLNELNHPSLRLYEERLVTSKTRPNSKDSSDAG